MPRVTSVALAVIAVSCGPQTDLSVAQSRGRLVSGQPLQKPNVMVLLDNSGSMLLPINPNASECPAGCGTSSANQCPLSCPTRVSEAKRALGEFFDASPSSARVGLTVFPSDALCGPPGRIDVDLPAAAADDQQLEALEASAQLAKNRVQSLTPIGGTPTAAALRFVGASPSMLNVNDGRDEWVVLITDGVPNCSDSNPNALCSIASPTAQQVEACGCTTTTCGGALCAKGCLDRDATLDAVEDLRLSGIRTVVVGYGSDAATGNAQTVFDSLAQAGGFTRKRGDGTTDTPYLHTSSGAELSSTLQALVQETAAPRCTWSVSELPVEGESLQVFIDGARVTAELEAATRRVTLEAGACALKGDVKFVIAR